MIGNSLVPQWKPGSSWLYRVRPGWKLAALLVAGTLLLLIDSLVVQMLMLVLVLALYQLSGVGLAVASRLLAGWKWLFGALWGIHVLFAWPERDELVSVLGDASLVVVRMATLMLLAGLVTATTRSSDLIDRIVRLLQPLRYFGVPVERLGLALGLTLRYIPLLAEHHDELREAHYARGIKPGLSSMLLPLLVRALKQSDSLADAIDARCYDSASGQPRHKGSDPCR